MHTEEATAGIRSGLRVCCQTVTIVDRLLWPLNVCRWALQRSSLWKWVRNSLLLRRIPNSDGLHYLMVSTDLTWTEHSEINFFPGLYMVYRRRWMLSWIDHFGIFHICASPTWLPTLSLTPRPIFEILCLVELWVETSLVRPHCRRSSLAVLTVLAILTFCCHLL